MQIPYGTGGREAFRSMSGRCRGDEDGQGKGAHGNDDDGPIGWRLVGPRWPASKRFKLALKGRWRRVEQIHAAGLHRHDLHYARASPHAARGHAAGKTVSLPFRIL